VPWGYTVSVVPLAKQLTIAATVLALSGSQAVLSACLALCFEGTPAAAVPHHGSKEAESVAAAPAAEHHGHHISPAAPEVTEAAAPLVDHGSAPRLKAPCGNCCPDGDAALVAGPRAERADVVALAIAPTTLSWQLPASVGRTVPSSAPPVSPPSPVGALTPLRI
jgi:hypothetical protein